jgi:ribonuclease R
MLDRGLRAVRPRRRARGARGRESPDRCGRRAGRRDLRSLPTFTIDPASARDFDDAISAERSPTDTWRVWVHIADVSRLRARGLARGPRGIGGAPRACTCPARSSRCCRGAVERRLLAGAGAGPARGHGRAARARAERRRAPSFYRSLIRSDERLDYERVDRIFAGASGRRSRGGAAAAAREAAAALAAGAPKGARRARARLLRARVRVRQGRARGRVPARCRRPSPTG